EFWRALPPILPPRSCLSSSWRRSGRHEVQEALLSRDQSLDEDTLPLDVRMQCPRCRTKLIGLSCMQCGLRMWTSHGIVHALPPERVAHFAQFMEDYER